MAWMYNSILEEYRKQAIEAAKDLCYGEGVIERVQEAKTEAEIQRIMTDARRNKFREVNTNE